MIYLSLILRASTLGLCLGILEVIVLDHKVALLPTPAVSTLLAKLDPVYRDDLVFCATELAPYLPAAFFVGAVFFLARNLVITLGGGTLKWISTLIEGGLIGGALVKVVHALTFIQTGVIFNFRGLVHLVDLSWLEEANKVYYETFRTLLATKLTPQQTILVNHSENVYLPGRTLSEVASLAEEHAHLEVDRILSSVVPPSPSWWSQNGTTVLVVLGLTVVLVGGFALWWHFTPVPPPLPPPEPVPDPLVVDLTDKVRTLDYLVKNVEKCFFLSEHKHKRVFDWSTSLQKSHTAHRAQTASDMEAVGRTLNMIQDLHIELSAELTELQQGHVKTTALAVHLRDILYGIIKA